MKRAQLLSQGDILEVNDLGLSVDLSHRDVSGKNTDNAELQAIDIQRALDRYNGVVSRAAKSLGISRQSFYRRMETFGLKS
jgi:transcriptional regulator of acetoin/glycerol metabolism